MLPAFFKVELFGWEDSDAATLCKAHHFMLCKAHHFI